MRHNERSRGRILNKTERILVYLTSHPGKIFRPKEIADALDFNLQTTVTALSRLAMEGTIFKEGRGRYCYVEEGGGQGPKSEGGGQGPKLNSVKEKYTLDGLEIDSNTAFAVYESIYTIVSESVGAEVIEDLTGLTIEDFDDDEPLKSIKKLIDVLTKVLGKELMDDVVNAALNANIEGSKLEELMGGEIHG